MEWEELKLNIQNKTVCNFRRTEDDYKRYTEMNENIKQTWCDMEDFILWREFNMLVEVVEDGEKKRSILKPEQLDLHPRYKIAKNNYRYDISPEVGHYLI